MEKPQEPSKPATEKKKEENPVQQGNEAIEIENKLSDKPADKQQEAQKKDAEKWREEG